ncbi:aminopeptidase P [Candidatus Saccharibacteria bacterium RAAC3_TM7_1]|nr:aminopeptidase P [Candidatus Saccharibacteria bacterium RAAC3_TM7_1]
MKSIFFTRNRSSLIQGLGGGLIVLSAYNRTQRRSDMAAAFSQEPNFWYLTGIDEPDWLVIIDGTERKSWLVMPETDEVHQVFEGGLSADEAAEQSGISTIIAAKDFDPLLRQLRRKHAAVYTVGPPPEARYFNFVLNPSLKKNQQKLERIFDDVIDCRKDLAKMRAIKQPEEIKAIQRAINVTTAAFESIRHDIESYRYEYEIEADFTHAFRRSGMTGHAYEPIVAAGKNACTLHYIANSGSIKKNALILMDIGAEAGGYAADITRTIQKGTASKRQLAVHRAVEEAQRRIIALLEPELNVEEYQRQVDEVMNEALKQLDLYNGEESIRRYMPHAVSHGLGIDVHDSLGGTRYLKSGMVLTVEPGIYIPEEGIGVRIEDGILITESGHRNLSQRLSTSP